MHYAPAPGHRSRGSFDDASERFQSTSSRYRASPAAESRQATRERPELSGSAGNDNTTSVLGCRALGGPDEILASGLADDAKRALLEIMRDETAALADGISDTLKGSIQAALATLRVG